MILRCSGRCTATFEADFKHITFVRIAARQRAGWQCIAQVHPVTGAVRNRDLCPVHYQAYVRRVERQREKDEETNG